MNFAKETYSIAIPAYSRTKELIELLNSINNMHTLPNEIIICEDFSKDRAEIKLIVESFRPLFDLKKVELNYIENEINLGYDANVRKLIDLSKFDWVVLIGNDDLFLTDGLAIIDNFCSKNKNITMVSRPFIRFSNDINKPLGVSRILPHETIVKKGDSAQHIFRLCGFVGGLVINKKWAKAIATDKYDGTLFYQIYLSANAFCENGIGYLGEPSVAGRAGNPPLFNSGLHKSGSYSAKGRASMWRGVLDIGKDIGLKYNINLLEPLRRELMTRQSFHVFESNVGVPKNQLNELKQELEILNIYNHYIPKSLYCINRLFGKYAYYFYFFVRSTMQ